IIVHNLSAGIAQGSIDVRIQRIAPITASVATHAFGGLGFGGVSNLGFQAVDSSYLLLYGDVGVIGLTMFALLYATAVVMVGRGVTSVGSFSGHGVELSCQDTNAGLAPQALLAGEVRGGPGQGELHIQAPDARRAFTTVQAIERTVHAAPHLQQVAFHRVGAF